MASAERVWRIGELLQWTEQFLAQKSIESPRLDAQILLAHALGCERIQLYTRFDEQADDESRAKFRELVRRRVEGCPVAYLVGRKEFFKLTFEVTPAVLIPRPATESLVMAALERSKGISAPRILDIGTGSGCIAVSVAHQLPNVKLIAIDKCSSALEIAQRNAERHHVANRVEFRRGDLFEPVQNESFDLILSNPPYIPAQEIDSLSVEVRTQEPRSALDGGASGFDIYDRIIANAAKHLTNNGWMLIEIGADQSDEAQRRVSMIPSLSFHSIIRDHDRHPRVVVAQKTPA